jgi:hypothetical protein
MAIDGRITVDVLFHDTDGTTSLKVVSLEDTTNYNAGKVAIVSGTVGTTQVTINVSPTTYRDSSGAFVSFSTVSRFSFAASAASICQGLGEDELLRSDQGRVGVTDASNPNGFSVAKLSAGTAAYTLVIYGT